MSHQNQIESNPCWKNKTFCSEQFKQTKDPNNRLINQRDTPPSPRDPQSPPTQIQLPSDGVDPLFAWPTRSIRPANTPEEVLPPPVASELLSGTGVRPTGLVTLFSLSTVSIAGPWSKKSTRMNVGCRPEYWLLHEVAASPRLPVPPDAPFVVPAADASGTSMPKDSEESRK